MSFFDPNAFATPVWTRTFAREVDRVMADRFGVEPLALMETAGRRVADAALDEGALDRRVVAIAGPGNNGGDALVAARHLRDAGCDTRVWIVPGRPGTRPTPAFERQLATVRAMEIPVTEPSDEEALSLADAAPVVIDGVLGLGFSGVFERSPARRALEMIARVPAATVIAVDTPSGLDADSGRNQELPARADVTVTFGAIKPALVISPARSACGRVRVEDIGFLRAAASEVARANPYRFWHADPERLLAFDPWESLSPEAHKFTRGHVLVIGGSPGKVGAPVLAAMAALRMGAGWATVLTREEDRRRDPVEAPADLTFEHGWTDASVDAAALETFLRERRVRAVVVGPGCVESPLDRDGWRVLKRFAAVEGGCVVVDAGATRGFLSRWSEIDDVSGVADRVIATPHPGEWERLGPKVSEPLDEAGLMAAAEASRVAGVTLMYKSATPILVTSGVHPIGLVVDEGTSVLARAGSGDVLAGAIAAHGAMGIPAPLAAARALIAVARASAMAARDVGNDSVLASDTAARLGKIMSPTASDRHGCGGGGCCHGGR